MNTLLVSVDASKGFWMYDGSLTTPPCTEGVKWTVMADVLTISQSQLNQFSWYTKGTATGSRADETEPEFLANVKTNSANSNNAAGNNRAL